jgi:hypothetical protein
MRTDTEQLENLFDELGLNVDLGTDTEIGVDKKLNPGNVDVQTTEITIYEPYDPNDPDAKTQNVTKNRFLDSGDQVAIHVFRRPRCPSCGYVPAEEGEPGHLIGECSECGTQTCPQCKTACNACDSTLCEEHSEGHAVVDETYCPEHVIQVQKQVEFERREERAKRKHNQRMEQQRLAAEQRRKSQKLQLEEERARLKQGLKKRKQRFDEQVEEKKLRVNIFQEKLKDQRERERLRKRAGNQLDTPHREQARKRIQSLKSRRAKQ